MRQAALLAAAAALLLLASVVDAGPRPDFSPFKGLSKLGPQELPFVYVDPTSELAKRHFRRAVTELPPLVDPRQLVTMDETMLDSDGGVVYMSYRLRVKPNVVALDAHPAVVDVSCTPDSVRVVVTEAGSSMARLWQPGVKLIFSSKWECSPAPPSSEPMQLRLIELREDVSATEFVFSTSPLSLDLIIDELDTTFQYFPPPASSNATQRSKRTEWNERMSLFSKHETTDIFRVDDSYAALTYAIDLELSLTLKWMWSWAFSTEYFSVVVGGHFRAFSEFRMEVVPDIYQVVRDSEPEDLDSVLIWVSNFPVHMDFEGFVRIKADFKLTVSFSMHKTIGIESSAYFGVIYSDNSGVQPYSASRLVPMIDESHNFTGTFAGSWLKLSVGPAVRTTFYKAVPFLFVLLPYATVRIVSEGACSEYFKLGSGADIHLELEELELDLDYLGTLTLDFGGVLPYGRTLPIANERPLACCRVCLAANGTVAMPTTSPSPISPSGPQELTVGEVLYLRGSSTERTFTVRFSSSFIREMSTGAGASQLAIRVTTTSTSLITWVIDYWFDTTSGTGELLIDWEDVPATLTFRVKASANHYLTVVAAPRLNRLLSIPFLTSTTTARYVFPAVRHDDATQYMLVVGARDDSQYALVTVRIGQTKLTTFEMDGMGADSAALTTDDMYGFRRMSLIVTPSAVGCNRSASASLCEVSVTLENYSADITEQVYMMLAELRPIRQGWRTTMSSEARQHSLFHVSLADGASARMRLVAESSAGNDVDLYVARSLDVPLPFLSNLNSTAAGNDKIELVVDESSVVVNVYKFSGSWSTFSLSVYSYRDVPLGGSPFAVPLGANEMIYAEIAGYAGHAQQLFIDIQTAVPFSLLFIDVPPSVISTENGVSVQPSDTSLTSAAATVHAEDGITRFVLDPAALSAQGQTSFSIEMQAPESCQVCRGVIHRVISLRHLNEGANAFSGAVPANSAHHFIFTPADTTQRLRYNVTLLVLHNDGGKSDADVVLLSNASRDRLPNYDGAYEAYGSNNGNEDEEVLLEATGPMGIAVFGWEALDKAVSYRLIVTTAVVQTATEQPAAEDSGAARGASAVAATAVCALTAWAAMRAFDAAL